MILEQLFAQLGTMTKYVHDLIPRGIAHWDKSVTYEEHARVIGADGALYKATAGNGPTTDANQQPGLSTSTDWETNWEREDTGTGHNIVACGKVELDGTAPDTNGLKLSGLLPTRREGSDGDSYVYHVVLETPLNNKVVALVQPTEIVDSMEVIPSLEGFTVTFSRSPNDRDERAFHFIAVGS